MSANKKSALVVLTNGVEEIEAISIIDILRRGGVNVVTAALGEEPAVLGSHNIAFAADALFNDVAEDDYDAIILPGGPGTTTLRECEMLHARLQRQRDENKFICAICAAPLVLVDAGVLEPDTHVTCYPSCAIDLDRPSVNVPVVCDDKIITAQGPGAATMFALVILKTLIGDKATKKVENEIVTNLL